MRKVITLLAALPLLLAGCGDEPSPPSAAAPSAPVSGTATPPGQSSAAPVPAVLRFTGTALDGEPFDGTGLAGRPVVLWFWAPWCPKCLSEGPAVAKAAAKHGGVAFVGVGGLDRNRDRLNGFVSRTGTSGLTHLDDRTGAVYKHFKVTSQSSYVFVSPSGATSRATGPLDEAELSDLIEKHTR